MRIKLRIRLSDESPSLKSPSFRNKWRYSMKILWHVYVYGRLGSICILPRNMTCPSLSNRGGGRGGGPRLRLDFNGIEDPDLSTSMADSS